MKQMMQSMKTGKIDVQDVPRPVLRDEGIIVQSRRSLISAGTERMVLQLGKKSLIGKAKERPDLVKKVLEKVKRDGFLATFKTVRDKLDSDIPLGYSNCGEVLEAGRLARQFEVGSRVACAGAGYANHAEINYIPRLLAVPVPDSVSTEAAAYATVGTIGLQGIRLADPKVGETVVVLGLGLIGQLCVQMLRAAGCRVVALDLSPERVQLAIDEGGADLALVLEGELTERQVLDFTRGRGADSILITAATSSNEPIELAARLARDRARVIMVGVTGMDIPRTPYFKKELTFIVSRSYGPGRYDIDYEEHGHDYPAGHVRWTENRNIEAFLDMVASGSVRPEVLTTHRFDIADAAKAFELILSDKPYLGVVLEYPESDEGPSVDKTARIDLKSAVTKPTDRVGVSFVGAGGFARGVLLPALSKQSDVTLRGIMTASGLSAKSSGDKFGFSFCTSKEKEIFGDESTDAIFIATPHTQHADNVAAALEAGRAVFVEKPLAIDLDGLRKVYRALEKNPQPLMVGFNRRFSPFAGELKQFLDGRGPQMIQYRCNAGPLPEGHWIGDPTEGGRIVGEACHFFDLFAYLTGASPVRVMAAGPSVESETSDDTAVTITYDDGSVCQLIYTSLGPGSYSKERIEAFAGGAVGVLEDFRLLSLHLDGKKIKPKKALAANKGHAAEMKAFIGAVREGKPSPISVESLFDTTLVSFATLISLQIGGPVELSTLRNAIKQEEPVE
jgi:predicted dehydrogenase/threonine dehydrogenase-like Zn-dependent dehydrogenase